MTALVLTTTTFTLERKKILGSFFTATNRGKAEKKCEYDQQNKAKVYYI